MSMVVRHNSRRPALDAGFGFFLRAPKKAKPRVKHGVTKKGDGVDLRQVLEFIQ
jgi:hypothetical protein